jgi:flavodoxin
MSVSGRRQLIGAGAFILFAILTLTIFSSVQCCAGQKTLIIYFSQTGNTKVVCEALQKSLGADILEVKNASLDKPKKGELPAIEPKSIDLTKYSSIILGSPVWAAQVVPAIKAVLKNNDFKGKKVAFFTTTNVSIPEEFRGKSKALVQQAGGIVVGYYEVIVADIIDKKAVPRKKDQLVADALKLVPELQKGF